MKMRTIIYKKENDVFYFALSKEKNISFLEEQVKPLISYSHKDFYHYLQKIEKPCHLIPLSSSFDVSDIVENWCTFSQIRIYLENSHERIALLMAIQYLTSGGIPDECSATEI